MPGRRFGAGGEDQLWWACLESSRFLAGRTQDGALDGCLGELHLVRIVTERASRGHDGEAGGFGGLFVHGLAGDGGGSFGGNPGRWSYLAQDNSSLADDAPF